MSPERFVEPAVVQALESTQEELGAEQRSLEPLRREQAALRERLGRLEAERERLRQDLEAFQRGLPASAPRLPASLMPPFEVHSRISWRRPLREALPSLILLGVMVNAFGTRRLPFMLPLFLMLLVFGARPLRKAWRQRQRWRFTEQGFEPWGPGAPPGEAVPYARVLGAEVLATPAQRRQGVGDVVVRRHPEAPIRLKDVPEPERLAEWLLARRPGQAPPGED